MKALHRRAFVAAVAAVLALPLPALAAEAVGRVIAVVGKPKIERAAGGIVQVAVNDPVYVGDTIRTGKGQLKLMFADNTLMTLDRTTDLKITQYLYQPQEKKRDTMLDLVQGKLKTLVGSLFSAETDFRVRTPTAVAGVRGTHFRVDTGNDTSIVVFEGNVLVKDALGQTLEVLGGQQVQAATSGFAGGVVNVPVQTLRRMEKEIEVRYRERTARQAGSTVDQGALFDDAQGGAGGSGGPDGAPAGDGADGDDGFQDPGGPSSPIQPPLSDLQPVDPSLQGNVKIRLQFPTEGN